MCPERLVDFVGVLKSSVRFVAQEAIYYATQFRCQIRREVMKRLRAGFVRFTLNTALVLEGKLAAQQPIGEYAKGEEIAASVRGVPPKHLRWQVSRCSSWLAAEFQTIGAGQA